MKHAEADQIRRFTFEREVVPARKVGSKTVSINAGSIHQAMGLKNRMPAVCGAIGADRFSVEYGVKQVGRNRTVGGSECKLDFFDLISSLPLDIDNAVW